MECINPEPDEICYETLYAFTRIPECCVRGNDGGRTEHTCLA